ncbi:radical SAM protein, partial [Pseudomonas aeruginosa]
MTDWIDGQGRQIDYLRLSVTDRCDFRCVYCMAEDMRFLPRQQVLTLEEIERVARLFVAGGVRKLRLVEVERLAAFAPQQFHHMQAIAAFQRMLEQPGRAAQQALLEFGDGLPRLD